MKSYVYFTIVVLLITTLLHEAMSNEEENSESNPKTVAEKTILVSYKKESSGDPNALTKEEIEKLENDLKNNYCKERGCEVVQHLKAVGILILRFNNLKSQSDEAKHLNSVLPEGVEGVIAEGDQDVRIE